MSSAPCQLIGCTFFENNTVQKADLSVYEITNSIVKRVENTLRDCMASRVTLVFIPAAFSLLPIVHSVMQSGNLCFDVHQWSPRELAVTALKIVGILQRYFWGFWFFLLLAVALETYQQVCFVKNCCSILLVVMDDF